MKKLIIGLVIGMLIGSSTMAIAATNDLIGTEIKAVFAGFNLKINGADRVLDTTPLVYNGTSYLPVRDMANLVGYDVTYKADSRTIEMNSSSAIAQRVTVSQSVYSNIPDLTGWMDLRTVAENYDISVMSGDTLDLTKGDFHVSYQYPSSINHGDQVISVNSNKGTIRMRFISGSGYLSIEDLRTLGLIPQ